VGPTEASPCGRATGGGQAATARLAHSTALRSRWEFLRAGSKLAGTKSFPDAALLVLDDLEDARFSLPLPAMIVRILGGDAPPFRSPCQIFLGHPGEHVRVLPDDLFDLDLLRLVRGGSMAWMSFIPASPGGGPTRRSSAVYADFRTKRDKSCKFGPQISVGKELR
jgi:hypothetical protein